ncbi:MAG: acyloxyacyl hydrolase [Gemmatimonadota bacterium]
MWNRLRSAGRLLAASIVLVALVVLPASAQPSVTEWGLGYASSFATGGPASVVHSTNFSSLEVVGLVRSASGSWWRIEHPIALIADARLANTALGPATAYGIGPSREWRVGQAPRATARAFGIRPLAVRLGLGPEFVSIQADAAGGALLFDIPAPAANTTRFNFTAEVALGLRVQVPYAHVAAGYRLHHLSNGGLGRVNPGVDSHMLYVEFTLF